MPIISRYKFENPEPKGASPGYVRLTSTSTGASAHRLISLGCARAEIDAELVELSGEIMEMLQEVHS